MTKKKFSSMLVLFFGGIVLAFFISSSAIKEAYRSRNIEKEVEKLRQEAKRIENENKQISERIAYFQTADFQEKIAKEKLNLQKPDENVVVIKQGIEKQENPQERQVEFQSEKKDLPNYKKWLNLFFGY